MKNFIFFLTLIWFSLNAFAQTPQAIKYLTLARNNAGEILASQNISFRMSILQGENSLGDSKLPGEYTVVYAETHAATTNALGLVTLEIGKGEILNGTFSAIDLEKDSYFVQVEIDPSGGNYYALMETTRLKSDSKEFPDEKIDNDPVETKNDFVYTIPGDNAASPMANDIEIENTENKEGSFPENTNQQIIVASQGWSGISSYLNPTNPVIENLFLPYPDKLIILYNQLGVYYPSQQLNTLINWDSQSGYIAKFDEETSIEFNGQPVQSRTVNLVTGWNLIPVLSECPADVAALFGASDVVVLKEVAGWKLYWPEMGINSINELLPGNAYYVLMNSPAEITFPNCGTPPWQCGDLLVDTRDSKTYNTVQIGTQCWMAQNLNIGTRIAGSSNQANNTTIEKYCYSNSEAQCDVYGGLYQWNEMTNYSTTPGVQGICPEGWHLPADAEWCTITTYLDATVNCSTTGLSGIDAGGKMKETGTTHWAQPNTGATNSSGFTGLPGGIRRTTGTFADLNHEGNWWTSTMNGSKAIDWNLNNSSAKVNRNNEDSKNCGVSVRCINDETLTSQLLVTPANQDVPALAGTTTFEVTSNTSWTVGESVAWLSVSPMAGSNNGTLTITYVGNTSVTQRNGQITITADGGTPVVNVTVTQAGGDPTLSVTPANRDVTSAAGNTTFEVTSNTSWIVSENADWLTVTPVNGSLNGTISVIYNINTTSSARTGVFTITDSSGALTIMITVIQASDCGQPITDIRDGKTYNTLQIGSQCWMAQNLNIGTRINGSSNQGNNATLEKWCYNDTEANCDYLGGLYQWDEMMQYTTTQGVKGICPFGWHAPTYDEWRVLQTYLSSQTAYTCNSNSNYIAKSLAATTDWLTNTQTCTIGNNLSANNATGFTGLPGGSHHPSGTFVDIGNCGNFWSSTVSYNTESLYFQMLYFKATTGIPENYKGLGYSVRCIRDNNSTSQVLVTPANQNVFALAGTTTFEVNSNTLWTISENVDWLSVTPNNGTHSMVLTVNYEVNAAYSSRTGEIIITTTGGDLSVTVTVLQQAWECGQPITDSRDSKTYNTVQIGVQCWMAQNLNIGTRISGATEQINNTTLEKYCYNNSEANCDVYGGLYQWNEMMGYNTAQGAQGICPTGWHIPTDLQLTALTDIVSHQSAFQCNSNVDFIAKSLAAATNWLNSTYTCAIGNNLTANNATGFTAMPGGQRMTDGSFMSMSVGGYWWSSSQYSSSNTWYRDLFNMFALVYRNDDDKSYGFSVRCLKDESSASQLFVTPANQDVSALAGTTTFVVNSSTSWSVSENVDWLSVTPFNGNLTETLTVSYNANPISLSRTGEITVTNTGGDLSVTITVIQQPWDCGLPLVDTRDSITYNTVQIGIQCWMAQNLNIGTRIDGSINQTDNATIEKYCYSNADCDVYGGLYQWDEMMNYTTTPSAQGICPVNWHLPANAEWCELTRFLDGSVDCSTVGWSGTDAGGKMKEAGTTHWASPNTGATNSRGFTALPGGYRNTDGSFNTIGEYCGFWSSTAEYHAWLRSLYYTNAKVSRETGLKGIGFSVRCIKDETPTSQLMVNPSNQDVSNFAGTTTFAVNSNTSWTVSENVDWLLVTPNNGNLNETIIVNYSLNATTSARTGIITVTTAGGDRSITVTVIQQPWICGQPLTDSRDSKTYNTVQIGTQCWMAQNLNIGTSISGVTEQTNNNTIEKYCYNDSEANCDVYGGLYQWHEMMNYITTPGVQGICPTGWHLPTDAEWCTITTYLDANVNCSTTGWSGTDVGGKMKETGTTHWTSPNTGATNLSGFTGLPGGYRYTDGAFYTLSGYGYLWSSSEFSTTDTWGRYLHYNYAFVARFSYAKGSGLSVRCIKDN